MRNRFAGLSEWGWDEAWENSFGSPPGAAQEQIGRVSSQDRDRWTVQLEDGPVVARIASANLPHLTPVTGDWVRVRRGPSPSDPVSILGVLPRRSALSRGSAGTGQGEQVLASNMDVIWIVHGLDTPPNLRRLERYLTVVWDSGAIPEIVLTKGDLAADPATAMEQIQSVALGVTVHLVSAEQPSTLSGLRQHLRPGQTVALVGPSGAGKSTLINALAGTHLAATGEVREDDRRGRHTTTRRELFAIAGGGLLMDTPGLRELRLWAVEDGLQMAFPEIEAYSQSCRFRDCEHETEPGCAVLAALEAGALSAERLESFRKLRAEVAYVERRSDPRAHAEAVARHKTDLKTLKYHPKYQRGE